jgi:hypothetical protein
VTAGACAWLSLALAGGAAGGIGVGVNDDAGKLETDSSWFFPTLASTGLSTNTITLRWNEYDPDAIDEREVEAIESAIARARANGVSVVLDLYPSRSQVFTGGTRCRRSADPESCGSTSRIEQFAAWTATVARTFPGVREYIVMNECNQPLFLNPQWNAAGEDQAAAICGRALAAAYDALKSVDRSLFVWGIGLSPRGNDRPAAASNSSTSPVRFLGALGTWFRAYVKKTGRTAPLMDGLDFHPYPVPQTLPFLQGYRDPHSASVTNLPRIYRAFHAAFVGTPQRTIGQQRGGGLPVSLNETGIQTDSSGRDGYSGWETSDSDPGGVYGKFATEAYQATWYVSMLAFVACDPNVRVVNIFHLVDEIALEGWQSGLYFADRTPKRSAAAVAVWLDRTGGECQGRLMHWTPAVLAPPAAPKKLSTNENVRPKAGRKARPKAASVRKGGKAANRNRRA